MEPTIPETDSVRRSPFYQSKMEAELIHLAHKTRERIRQGTDTLTQRELYPDEEELSVVQNVTKDIQIEEFPEGAYGSSVYLDEKIGKSSPWEVDQHVISPFQDESPVFSGRRIPTVGEEPDEPSPAHGGESPEINN
jgi:hypothetical protein